MRSNITCDILINATPLGMFGKFSKKTPIYLSKKFYPKLIYDLSFNFIYLCGGQHDKNDKTFNCP